eukprot:1157305-Pelagomonas_calceolata.AAC.5
MEGATTDTGNEGRGRNGELAGATCRGHDGERNAVASLQGHCSQRRAGQLSSFGKDKLRKS